MERSLKQNKLNRDLFLRLPDNQRQAVKALESRRKEYCEALARRLVRQTCAEMDLADE